MQKEKVVVTGGAGFIGSHLAAALITEGYDVHVLDNLSNGSKDRIPEHAEFHDIDILDIARVQKVVLGTSYVFHCAANASVQYSLAHPVESNAVNVQGTLHLLQACAQAKVKRLVYPTSASTYGASQSVPLVETEPRSPLSPYAAQKWMGEIYSKLWSTTTGLSTVCLLYFNVYGPGQSPHGVYASVIPKFIALRAAGKPLTVTGDGSQTRDFVHVRDVVRANLLAATSDRVGAGEVINIASGVESTVAAVARLIGGEISYIPLPLEVRRSCADISKAKKILGWEPTVTLEQGIAELKALQHLK